MDDFGIYSWQDGRMYEGFYFEDKKHGYGVYTWSDSKRYAGWWSEGKQHGLGIFISKEGKKKLGIWEDGKKVRWFNSEEANLIEAGNLTIKEFLPGGEKSWSKIKDFPLTFQPVENFYEARNKLSNKLKDLQIEGSEEISEVINQSNSSIPGVD